MKREIQNRVLEESNYILKTESTIRETAKKFKVSKSTVHKDIHERLLEIDTILYNKINSIMKYHIDVRHIRGGESTKKKYKIGNNR